MACPRTESFTSTTAMPLCTAHWQSRQRESSPSSLHGFILLNGFHLSDLKKKTRHETSRKLDTGFSQWTHETQISRLYISNTNQLYDSTKQTPGSINLDLIGGFLVSLPTWPKCEPLILCLNSTSELMISSRSASKFYHPQREILRHRKDSTYHFHSRTNLSTETMLVSSREQSHIPYRKRHFWVDDFPAETRLVGYGGPWRITFWAVGLRIGSAPICWMGHKGPHLNIAIWWEYIEL